MHTAQPGESGSLNHTDRAPFESCNTIHKLIMPPTSGKLLSISESLSGLLYVIIHVASESREEWNESTCATFRSWQEREGTSSRGNWRRSRKGAVVGRVKVNYPGKVYSLRAINSGKLFPPQVYRAKEVTANPKRIIMWKEQPCRAMAFSRGPQPAMAGP